MRKTTRSILDELASIGAQKDQESLIESRASNVIAGAINLINYIKEHYDTETAEELERRLLNSIRSQEPAKFARKIRSLREHKRDENEN